VIRAGPAGLPAHREMMVRRRPRVVDSTIPGSGERAVAKSETQRRFRWFHIAKKQPQCRVYLGVVGHVRNSWGEQFRCFLNRFKLVQEFRISMYGQRKCRVQSGQRWDGWHDGESLFDSVTCCTL
jgi:hypothetical protein